MGFGPVSGGVCAVVAGRIGVIPLPKLFLQPVAPTANTKPTSITLRKISRFILSFHLALDITSPNRAESKRLSSGPNL
jgi:hypothetical protein